MGLPVGPLISAVTPLVLGALDLYRRRKEEQSSPGALKEPRNRFEELEASDLEQARLISGLSTSVEALAKTLEREMEQHRKTHLRLRQMVGLSVALSALSLGLGLWLAFR